MADLKGAFDNIKRSAIWKEMEKMEICTKLRTRIREIYEETKCEVVVRGKNLGSFNTEKRVRQRCPLSPTLFNISMAPLEKEMSKVQEGGIVIRKKKIYSIGYADDVILLANNEVGIQEMIGRFGKFIERRGLELNTKKTKIIRFRRNGRKGTDPVFKWKDEIIEIVNEETYLRYKMQSNNGDTKHINYITGKANPILGKIWSIGERKFKEDWERRMKLFDAYVHSVMTYGAEIWGYKEWKEVEKIQN